MSEYAEQSIICPVMVGRDLPAQALLRLFQQVGTGQGQIALVSGEAGIGKSRLIRELRLQVQSSTMILEGNCFETDRTLPYAAISDLLRTFFSTLTSAHRNTIIKSSEPEFFRLLPELKQDFPNLTLLTGEDEQEKRRLQQVLTQVFADLSAARPLLVIIEDVHWCDDASLEFLLFLARRLSGLHLLLLLTYRDDEVSPTLAGFLAQLDRGRLTTEFRLPRLTADTVSVMMRAIFAMERLPRGEFVEAIHNLSEGNPFFIEEMLKSLVAEGGIFLSDGKWERKPLAELHIPRTVQVSLQQRLSRLTPAAREILSIAAVAGKHFDFTLLQRLTGSTEIELLRLMRELKNAQFVVEENAEIFAFRHALTRQAVYQELFARERRVLHGAIAEIIQQLYSSGSLASTHLSDLAYHYYQAEHWEKAAECGWAAGQYAEALYAPRAALEHYSRALDSYDHLHISPPLPLLRARGKVLEITGNFAAAGDDYLKVLQKARETSERHLEWQSLLDLGFLYTGLDFAQSGRYFHDAIRVARELENPTALADSLNRLGNWYINQDLPVDALPYHLEALANFERLNDLQGQAATLDLLGVTGVVSGDIVNSAAYYDQAIRLFRQLDNRIGLSSSLSVTCNRGGNCMEETVYCPPTGLDFLLHNSDEARQIASATGWQHGEAAADMYASYGLIVQGEYELALTYARRGMEIATAASHTLYKAALEMALGRLYNELFAFEAARDILEPALQTARKISGKFLESSIGGFLVSSYVGLGELNQATELINELRTEQMQSVGQRIIRYAEAELALARGQAEQAIIVIEQLIETAPSSEGKVIARLWYLKAEALLALGKVEISRGLLQEAIDSARAGNLVSVLWRVLVCLGKVELVAGHLIQAETHFDAARDLLETLANKLTDMTLHDQFLARANKMIPEKPPVTPRMAAKQAYDGLTEREREIAVLIADGKSSREIAELLVLSKRTVDAHTTNILSKLGFSSRIQIARWALEKGLL